MKTLEQQLQASVAYVAQRKRAEAERERRRREERLWTDEELASVHAQIDQLLGDVWLRAMLRRRRA
jgi:hypothetical protein